MIRESLTTLQSLGLIFNFGAVRMLYLKFEKNQKKIKKKIVKSSGASQANPAHSVEPEPEIY